MCPKGRRSTPLRLRDPGGPEATGEFLAFSNMEISKAVLGQTLTTEMQGSGSYAAAKTHFAVRHEIVESDKRIVEETMNGLISFLYELNFGSDEPKPVFMLYEKKEVQRDRAERDETLSNTGVRFTKEYYTREYDLRDEDFDLGEPKPEGGKHGEFAETTSQKFLDKFEEALGNMDEELQGQAAATLDVIFSLAESSTSFSEFSKKIAAAYPELDTESLSKQLAKAGFVAQVWGGMNAEEG